ncbi:presenilins-associated rhomboid-like protein, mitochondrial [Anoplophora glabripennis]|uniref:presenilins-associated rhomboid-like protein, mitochondrial n=1 Tax=Anoplophora glabripennis TaxID=217634 RepID=UPI00087480CA|nr:presenilins-associated rhomboid-like protein, mitochondrial [Anoplophora glabripennis]
MALSRMFKISDLCFSKGILLKKQNFEPRLPSNIRNFKRGKIHREEPKANPESLATPFTNVTVDSASLHTGKLVKPFLFTIGFSGASFLGAAIWEYENMRAHAISMIKRPIKFFRNKSERGIEKSNEITREVKQWWNNLTPGEKLFVPICAINVLVFVAWRIPKLQPFMMKYFCSNPASENVCLPMILSTFSHYSGFHLLANMYVLHSFSTGAVHSLGKEQFLALYLTAGVFSSFTSYLYKVITKQPGLSLGASGAIMGILGYVCTQFPDTRLGIILLPVFTFSAGAAIKFIIALDAAGVVMAWKFFDHAAHLGGATCGIFWTLWGNQYIWQKREPVLHYWHEIRGSIK